jgi:hypothetical protein
MGRRISHYCHRPISPPVLEGDVYEWEWLKIFPPAIWSLIYQIVALTKLFRLAYKALCRQRKNFEQSIDEWNSAVIVYLLHVSLHDVYERELLEIFPLAKQSFICQVVVSNELFRMRPNSAQTVELMVCYHSHRYCEGTPSTTMGLSFGVRPMIPVPKCHRIASGSPALGLLVQVA